MRIQLWWVAAVIVTVAGVAGLARGATPQGSATGGATNDSPPIVVTGAYIRQPSSPDVAAAYFTVYNTTKVADTLLSADTGAGEEATLHSETNGSMTITPNGVVIPAHGSVVFKPTTGHVMIQKLYGALLPGQTVDIELDFANAGQVIVVAPVIGIYAAAPTGAAATSAPASAPASGSTSGPASGTAPAAASSTAPSTPVATTGTSQ
jgi:periplasmic copper chaperone A